MFHHYRHGKADNVEAQGYFRRALVIDAQYPQATAALAIAVCNAAYLGWAEDIEKAAMSKATNWRSARLA